MFHAWYSNQHDLMCGGIMVIDATGKPQAATFTCDGREKGERFVAKYLAHFPDYIYIGEFVQYGECWPERPEDDEVWDWDEPEREPPEDEWEDWDGDQDQEEHQRIQ